MWPDRASVVWHRVMTSIGMIAIGADRAWAFLATGAVAPEPQMWRELLRLASVGWECALQWTTLGYESAPVLMVGLALTAGIPVLALLGWIIARAVHWYESEQVPIDRADQPRDGRIRIEGQAMAFLISGELIRIGRQDDNDVCLAHATVQSYHALIRRSPDFEFVITDLTDEPGRGIRVNGHAVAMTRLADGGCIEVGDVKLNFEAGPH